MRQFVDRFSLESRWKPQRKHRFLPDGRPIRIGCSSLLSQPALASGRLRARPGVRRYQLFLFRTLGQLSYDRCKRVRGTRLFCSTTFVYVWYFWQTMCGQQLRVVPNFNVRSTRALVAACFAGFRFYTFSCAQLDVHTLLRQVSVDPVRHLRRA